jgi:flagellin
MISLITNVAAQSAQTANKSAERLQAQAMHRLSTGVRVNAAQDDAAGLAIGVRMTSTINAANELIKGMANGVSLAQVAEGGLQNIAGLLQRMRELSVQSVNDTLTTSDRSALNQEFQALNGEIDRISRNTQIFDRTPLAAPQAVPVPDPAPIGNTKPIDQVLTAADQNFNSGLASMGYIPKGFTNVTLNLNSFSNDDDIQIFTTDGKHLLGTPILNNTDPVWVSGFKNITSAAAANSQIMNTANAFDAGASYDGSLLPTPAAYNINTLPITQVYKGMTIRFSGDGHPIGQYPEKVTIDVVTENLVVMVIGSGVFSANGTWTKPPPVPPSTDPFSEDTTIVLSARLGQGAKSLTIKATPSDTKTLGTATSQIATASGASAAIGQIDLALQKVNESAVGYGALMSRLTSAADNLSVMVTQTSASRSTIIDTDYASEAAKLATQQILQESSTAILAQANALPNSVLSLLDQQLG